MTSPPTTRVVVATDKFRSTATTGELWSTIRDVLGPRFVCDEVPVSDGGEGFRAAFAGETSTIRVRGPWGEVHEAPVTRLRVGTGGVAVLEVAEIIGRGAHAASSREALAASSAGLGDALVAAAALDVERIVVGCGGSATSDGGEGCYEVWRAARIDVALTAATDITATFFGAARYAAQKGVDPADLVLVQRRLREVATRFARERGRDVTTVPRTGAAGGLAGALYALGADLVSGFDEVARVSRLGERVSSAEVIITGEGRLDMGSLEGKVVAGVCALTRPEQRVLVVCGTTQVGAVRELCRRYPWVRVEDLVARFGERRAHEQTLSCVADVVSDFALG
ncbi:MAG: glycerate kinase [Acidobacteria bacterium]|nr:glycerate kinase [Acidobacteriota bacterium]